MEQPTVFIVDDDAAVRDSITELVTSVGLRAESYASAQAFLDAFRPHWSGCLVLDVRMAGLSGLALQEKLVERGFGIPVIVLTGHGDVPMAVRALKAGAVDFIQKPYRDQLLLDSINSALALGSAAGASSAATSDLDGDIATLTSREREVLDKLLEGGTSKQIARDLGISPRTVEAHRQNLLRKLGVGSLKELILRRVMPSKDK
jgi:FixJ family two-component response regulator